MREVEEFYAAYQTMAAARDQFQRHVRVGSDPGRHDDMLLLTAALNAATYRYLVAVEKLSEIDHADPL